MEVAPVTQQSIFGPFFSIGVRGTLSSSSTTSSLSVIGWFAVLLTLSPFLFDE
jgi:hypothetical protein